MNFLQLFTLILFMAALASSWKNDDISNDVVSRTITVDKSGQGDFTAVQQAIDAVPQNNSQWILIHIKPGIYNEKIVIEHDKPFIVLEGESSRTTVIAYEDGGQVIDSTIFKLFADNFAARYISFKNLYNHYTLPKTRDDVKHKMTWAPAALIMGDKVSFYRCGFISLQDTLSDFQGRHYYDSCYIEGAVDFIWGNGQSLYQRCVINVTTSVLGGPVSYITAQGRESASQSTGFVFHTSILIGTGPAYLGRAFRNFSRVLYYKTKMEDIVTQLGWDAWDYVGHEDLFTYAEVGCMGPGADTSKRVNWEKQLPYAELLNLIRVDRFINQDHWLENQP